MGKRGWILSALAAFAVICVVLGVLIARASGAGDYDAAGKLASSELRLNADVQNLSKSVGRLKGVASSTLTFLPLHLPAPAASIVVRMTATASLAQDTAAIDEVHEAFVKDRFAPEFLSFTMERADGSTLSEKEVNSSVEAVNEAVTAWGNLVTASGQTVVLSLSRSGAGVLAQVTGPSVRSPKATSSFVAAYPQVVAAQQHSSLIAQWISPGLSTQDGFPPLAIVQQLAAESTSAVAATHSSQRTPPGAELFWDGSHPDRSNLTVSEPINSGYAIADSSMRMLISNSTTVSNVLFLAGTNTKPVGYRIYFGACSGPVTQSKDDVAYFAHLAAIGIALPAGSGAGSCSRTS